MGAFFEEWLVPGAKAFVPRRWPDAAEATRSSTAPADRPSSRIRSGTWSDPDEVAALIDDLDLDGVECFYPAARPGADEVPARAVQGSRARGDGLL